MLTFLKSRIMNYEKPVLKSSSRIYIGEKPLPAFFSESRNGYVCTGLLKTQV